MTSASTLPTSDVRTWDVSPPGPVVADACAVCPHPLAAHDAIALRFCKATQALSAGGPATRGCVCPSS
jgi:hypothetical protein